jgi:hypothetical protein
MKKTLQTIGVASLALLIAISAVIPAMSTSAQTAPTASCYTYFRDLTLGSTGADVIALQTFLVNRGHLVMPTGVQMGYFGSLTRVALSKYQASKGITPTAGYFGQLTRARVAQDCTTTPPPHGGLNGGDGDFKDFDVLGNPNSTDIEEGETEEVLGFEFEADDSDLLIERLDVLFGETGSNTDKPWKVLDTITLTIDGDEVAEIDASDSDAWEEEQNDEYSVRFDDIDTVVKDGDTVKAYVTITAQDRLDSNDLGNWSVEIMNDGLRALNADRIQVYEGRSDDDIDGDSDERTFSLDVATAGELSISVDSDENEDRTVEVDDDNDTNDEVIYLAMVDSDEGDNIIEEVTVTIATTTGTTNGLSDFVKTLYLFVDGDEVGSETVSDDDGSESIVFDDLDIELSEDDEIEFEVRADFDNQDGNYSSGTTGLYVDSISIDYVDEQDDDQTTSDSSNGGEIILSVDALTIELADTPSAISPLANDESKGRFYVEFEVTAPSSEDIYIPYGATTSTAVGSGKGAEFIVVNSNGTQVTATTTDTNNVLRKVSGASDTGSYYKISKGNTATFSLQIIVDNDGYPEARTLGIQLTGLNYKVGSATTPDNQFTSGLDEDFRSDTAYLLNSNTSN